MIPKKPSSWIPSPAGAVEASQLVSHLINRCDRRCAALERQRWPRDWQMEAGSAAEQRERHWTAADAIGGRRGERSLVPTKRPFYPPN